MKKMKFFTGIVLIFTLFVIFISCSDEVNEIVTVPSEERNLTAVLSYPVLYAAKQTSFNAHEYTAEIEWYYAENSNAAISGNFESFSAATFNNGAFYYRAIVTLDLKTGYTFDGLNADVFTHDYAWSVKNPKGEGESLTVTVDFAKPIEQYSRPITMTSLMYVINMPISGELPQDRITDAQTGMQYEGGFTWSAGWQLGKDEKFEPDIRYTAIISLTPCPGYRLIDLDVNSFSFPLAESIEYNKATGALRIVFRKTAIEGQEILTSAFNLSNIPQLNRPKHRTRTAELPTSFTQPQYNGTIAWYYADDNTPVLGTVEYGRYLKALVSLTSRVGYTFDGLPANAFIHPSSTVLSVSSAANSGDITIYYGKVPWELSGGGVTIATANEYFYPEQGASFKACCYFNDSPPYMVFDVNNTEAWFEWGRGTATYNNSNWPAVFIDPLQGTGVGFNGSDNSVDKNECNSGHPTIFIRPEIPEKFRRHAHCYTLDMGRVVENIVRLDLRSKGSRSPGTYFPQDIEVYHSLTDIGPIPGSNAVYAGEYTTTSGSGNGQWVSFDIFQGTPDGSPFTARYIHFRVYKTVDTDYPGDPIRVAFTGIRVQTVSATAFP